MMQALTARTVALLRLVIALALAACLGTAAARDAGGTLATVPIGQLPPEAQQTLRLIKQGGPFPYPRRDGSVFGNREKHLPIRPRGYYHEYTVPTPGARDRGARRIVSGGDPRTSDEHYYSDDHYASFRRIRE